MTEEEMKTGLEDLAKGGVPNGEGDQAKTGGSSEGSGDSQKSKSGWITALPEDLRKGVDAEKYASMAEYIRDLQNAAAEKTRDKELFEKNWDSFVDEAKASGAGLPEAVVEALRGSDIPAEAAAKAIKALANHGNAIVADRKKRLTEYVQKEWGADFDERNSTLKRGMAAFDKAHPGMLEEAQSSGLMFSVPFVQLLVDYASYAAPREREHQSPEGMPKPPEDADNPYGLRNI